MLRGRNCEILLTALRGRPDEKRNEESSGRGAEEIREIDLCPLIVRDTDKVSSERQVSDTSQREAHLLVGVVTPVTDHTRKSLPLFRDRCRDYCRKSGSSMYNIIQRNRNVSSSNFVVTNSGLLVRWN